MSTRSSPSSTVISDPVEALARSSVDERDDLGDQLDQLGTSALRRVAAFHADWQPDALEAIGSRDPQRIVAAIEKLLTEEAPDIVVPAAWILAHHEEDATAALLRLTRHRRQHVREAAAWALGRIPPLELEDALRVAACLGDESDEVRRRVAATLERAESVEGMGTAPLEAATRDSAPELRMAACRLLARVGAREDDVLRALEGALGADDEGTRLAAALALVELGVDAPDESAHAVELRTVHDALQEPESRVRFLAALASRPTPRALAFACTAVPEDSAQARAGAAEAIGGLAAGLATTGEGHVEIEAAVDVLATLLDDEDADVRGRAVAALARLPVSAIQPVTGDLLSLLEAEDGELLLEVARILAAADQAAPAIASLIDLTDDDDVYRCASAARVLGELFPEDPDADEVLRELLLDEEPEVRIEAALAIAEHQDPGAEVMKIVAEGLGSGESRVRRRAAECLGSADGATTEQALVRALSHSQWRTREVAAGCIGDLLAPTATLVPVLAEALQDPKPAVRRAAIVAAGDLLAREDFAETAETLQPILRERLGDTSARTRLTAAVVLAALEERGDEIAGALAAGLASEDPELRRMAAGAHEQAEDLAARNAPALAALLGDEDELLRDAAATALASAGEQAQDALLATLRAAPTRAREAAILLMVRVASLEERQVALREALADASPRVRLRALSLMVPSTGQTAEPASPEVWELLLAATQDRNPSNRSLALRVLTSTKGEGRDDEVVAALTLAMKDPEAVVRAQVVPNLSGTTLPAEERAAICAALLGDSHPVVAANACTALRELPQGAEKALPELRAALDSEHEDLRIMAACLLVDHGETEDAIPLLTAALASEDSIDRRIAAQGLSSAGEAAAPARDALLACAADQDWETRGQVAVALGGLASEDADVQAALRHMLDDEAAQVRLAAITGLQRAGVTDATLVKKLAALLQDSDQEVRMQACAMLSQMGAAARRTAPAVSVLLGHDSTTVQAMAAFTLASIIEPSDEVVETLVRVLETDESMALRIALAAARRLGDRAAPLAPGLARLLLGGDADLAHSAAIQLEMLGAAATAAADRLIAALGSVEQEVSLIIADILARAATDSSDVLDRIVAVAGAEDPARQRDAFTVLMKLPSSVRFPARSLLGALQDADPALRGKAALALGRESATDSVIRSALEQLLDDDEHTVRLAGAAALATPDADTARLTPIFESALDSEEPRNVALAAAALGKLGAAAAPQRERLATAFTRQDDVETRAEIIHAFGCMGAAATESAELIAGYLGEVEHASARHLCIWSLVEINAPAGVVIDTLRSSLSDPVEANRADAAYALGRLKPRSVTQTAIPDLITMLESDTPGNRVMAASVLGEFGPRARKAVDALQVVRQAEDQRLSSTATWALERIQPDLV